MKSVELRKLHHRGNDCIAIFFKKDNEIAQLVRNIPGIKFSITHRCWYLPESGNCLETILKRLNGIVEVDLRQLQGEPMEVIRVHSVPPAFHTESPSKVVDEGKREALTQMEQKLKLRGYSPCTLRTYVSQFRLFLQFYHTRAPGDLQEIDIRNYLLYLIDKRKLSIQSQNQAINAIKFYYEKVLKHERKTYYLDRPMKERKLPTVMSEEEIISIFQSLGNLKHKLMLMTVYASGIRRSELLNLRISDMDFDRLVVFVRGGKGKKDRQSILARNLIPYFQEYMKQYRPAYWLFEGEGGGQYSASSLHKVMKTALHKAGIRKEAALHTLRHSFATHMLEDGRSTIYIQKLLGHESSRTTEIYAHVTRLGLSKLHSPLDNIPGKRLEK